MKSCLSRAFTLIELMVVIGIIAVLTAMLLPAVQKVRATASRLSCQGNLKQHGLALHAYNDVYGMFPPSTINPSNFDYGQVGTDYFGNASPNIVDHTGWSLLLPFLEQDALFRKVRLTNSSTLPVNLNVVGASISLFACPSDTKSIVLASYPSGSPAVAGAINLGTTDETTDDRTDEERNETDPPRDVPPHVVPPSPVVSIPARPESTNYLLNIYHQSNELVTLSLTHPMILSIIWPDFQYRGPLIVNRGTRFGEITDGTTQTILVGETKRLKHSFGNAGNNSTATDRDRTSWGVAGFGTATGAMHLSFPPSPGTLHINFPYSKAPLNAGHVEDPADRYLQADYGYGSWHAGGANFLFCDGSVRFLPNRMAFTIYQELGSANSGLIADQDY